MGYFKTFSEKQKLILTWWAQKKYANFNSIICDGSIRCGKTVCLSLSFVFWASFNFNNQVFAICAKTIEAVKRNIIFQLTSHLESLGFCCRANMSKNYMDISFNGTINRFYFFGGNDEKSASLIQGITLAGVFLDEVVLMPRSFVEQALARCSFLKSKYFFNCNPENPFHWFYTEWIEKAKEKNALYLKLTMKDNPFLSNEMIKRYEKLYTGSFYKRFVQGIWAPVNGQVYPMFNKEKHVVSSLPEKFEKFIVSCDYGTVNPSSFGLWGKHNKTWFRIKEYYNNSKLNGIRLTDEEQYEKLKELIGRTKVEAVVVDPSAASFIECIKKHNNFKVFKASNDVLKGINLVSSLLNKGLIKFHESCKDTIREFHLYQWSENKNFDSVKKENDHAMDDIRYFCSFVFEESHSKKPFFVYSVNRENYF